AAGMADAAECIDHATGAVIDRQGMLFSFGSAFKARDLIYHGEPLATLGDSLVLTRLCISGSGFAGARFDVGPYEREEIGVTEVDAQGRRRRIESFPPARLGDAVVRLYERYAEILPAGPARDRAAATARSVAAVVKALEPESARAVMGPGIEYVEHRRLGLFASVHGIEAVMRRIKSLGDVAENVVARIDDVLALRPDALVYRRTIVGTDRATGGPF